MDELEHILREYGTFESEVRVFSSELWFQWCSNCREVCCNALYCRETFESPFLFLLLNKYSHQLYNNTQKAWLSEAGCKLSVGRPPVCYEFLCANILDAQQTGMHRYAMIVLSKLISHIGKMALGSRHLIEVMDPANLKKVKYSRFEKRLSEARNAFDVVQLFFSGHKLENDALKVLSKISRPNLRKENDWDAIYKENVGLLAKHGPCLALTSAGISVPSSSKSTRKKRF